MLMIATKKDAGRSSVVDFPRRSSPISIDLGRPERQIDPRKYAQKLLATNIIEMTGALMKPNPQQSIMVNSRVGHIIVPFNARLRQPGFRVNADARDWLKKHKTVTADDVITIGSDAKQVNTECLLNQAH
jgi:hypothetical protein